MRLPISGRLISPSLFTSHDAFIPRRLSPKGRVFAIGAVVSVAGLLYGLDTGSIGPVTQMKYFNEQIGPLSASLQGFYVASILLSASISSFLAGIVADRFSRRYGVAIGAIIFGVGAIISAASTSYGMLQVARLVSGIGQGQTFSVASIYLVEIASKENRGRLASLLQVNVAVGIMVGYFICYGTQRLSNGLSWRLPFIVQAIVAFTFAMCTLIFVPFSPRWLVQKGFDQRAIHVLSQLRLTTRGQQASEQSQVAAEFQAIKEVILSSQRDNAPSWASLFTKRYRSRSILGIVLMSLQQLSGIDVVLYFAPIVFATIFTSQTASFLASGVTGIVLVAATIPTQIWIDKWGRKPPIVLGGLFMALCFLSIGVIFALYSSTHDGTTRLTTNGAKYSVVALVYIFVALFSMTWAATPRIYTSEIMPTRLRSRAAATQQLSNWSTNFAVTLTAPPFLAATPSGPYFFFGGALLIATILCLVAVKETKGKTLEEIELMFEPR